MLLTFTTDERAEYEALVYGSDWHNVTVGRKKRKRKPGAGSAVKIKSHTRSPRGPNAGKRRVRVDAHGRGRPPKKGRKRSRR